MITHQLFASIGPGADGCLGGCEARPTAALHAHYDYGGEEASLHRLL